MPSTNGRRLEVWLGTECVARLSQSMRGWYGPPIPISGVPSKSPIFAHGDGDFSGEIRCGSEVSALERAENLRASARRDWHPSRTTRAAMQARAVFSSLSDIISAQANGKGRQFFFQKTGPTGVANGCSTLWRVGAFPASGSASSAAPGGSPRTSADTGAWPFTNPTAPDIQCFVSAFPLASVAANTLLLYDRLFDVLKTMNSTATEAVTGVPTRYQNTTATAQDYIGGNFVFPEVGGTALAATGHNWTVCQYTNQAGTVTQSIPSVAGVAGAITDRLDLPLGQFFMSLNGSDTGIKALTQMQCSAAVATGIINFVIGHPIAWLPCPAAGLVCNVDGINSAFNLNRVFDNACLALMEVCKPSTGACNYTGSIQTVAG